MARTQPYWHVGAGVKHSGQKRIAAITLMVMLSHVAEDRYQRVSAMLRQFIRHSEGFRDA